MVRSVTDYSATSGESVVDNYIVDTKSTWDSMRAEAKRREEREKVEQKLAREKQLRRAERQKIRAKKVKEDQERKKQEEKEAKRNRSDHGGNAEKGIEDLERPSKAVLRSSTRSESLNVSRPSNSQRHHSEKSLIHTRRDLTHHIIDMPYETAASIDDIKVQQGFAELRSSLQWAAKNAIQCLDNMTKVIDSYYAENIALMNVPNRLDNPTTSVIDVDTGDIVTVDNQAYDAAVWQQLSISLDYSAARMGADMARLITRRRADEYIRGAKDMLMKAGRYEARVYTIQYPPYCALLSWMPIWTTCRWYGKGMSLYQSISSWTMEMLPGAIDVALSVITLLIAFIAFFFTFTPTAHEGSIRGVKPPQNSSVPGCLRFFIQTFNFRDTRETIGVPMLTISSLEANVMEEEDKNEKISETTTFLGVRYCLKNYEWASAQQIYNLGTHIGPISDMEALKYAQFKSSGIEMSFTDKIIIFPIRSCILSPSS